MDAAGDRPAVDAEPTAPAAGRRRPARPGLGGHRGRAAGGADLLRRDQRVTITARFSSDVVDPAVEYFADDLGKPDADEPKQLVPLVRAGEGYAAELPGFPERAVVRYRIVGRRAGAARAPISPRATDPFAWHLMAVSADVPAGERSYQVLIAPAQWTRMWTNLGAGRVQGCEVNPTWDQGVPAVLVAGGKAYDVRARYQGSTVMRKAGYDLPAWPAGLGPAQPVPLKALSWRLDFPRYRRLGKRSKLILGKQFNDGYGCPGTMNLLAGKLHRAAGTPTTRIRFARLYVNGAYYHYMAEVDTIGEETVQAIEGAGRPLGDLFKADGGLGDEGPWAPATWAAIKPNPKCPERWTALDRYRRSYERQTHGWMDGEPDGHRDIVRMIEALDPLAARFDWRAARALIEKDFDFPQLVTQWAVRNYAGAFDDAVHNYFVYRRARDGKWMMLPYDFEGELGGRYPPTRNFLGNDGNILKYVVIACCGGDLKRRARELMAPGGPLHLDQVLRAADEAFAEFDLDAWNASPAIGKCDAPARMKAVKDWIRQRHDFLERELAK